MPWGVQHFRAHIMPLVVQHFRAQLKPLIGHQGFCTHFNVLQAKHKQLNFHKQKRAYTSPNSSTKIHKQPNKVINNKRRLTHQKSLHTFIDAIPERYMDKYIRLPP
jgi:hypothetical protein